MGRVNVCLKRSYIIVTSLIVIINALLLALTLFSHGYLHNHEEIEKFAAGLHGMYAVAIIPLLLSSFGLYGACKQKKWALIVFAVGMILSSLFMIVCEINALAAQSKMAKDLTRHYLNYLPLSNVSDDILNTFQEIQMEFQCCGLDQGYLDWGQNITKSCLCIEGSTLPCVAAPRNSIHFETDGVQPVMIYKEPCLPQLIAHHMAGLYILLGIMLGITLLWVLSVALCIVILCHLNRKEDTPTVVYSPEAKAGNYITLTDAADYT
uniref:tetraspanin-8-like n=1 Tax=Semicossyphus pulcher TaxID=241346 RepID=UPI0037E7DD60